MRSLRILSQKREKKYQGGRIAPLSFKFKREREREKGSMGLGKNMSPDFGSIKKKNKTLLYAGIVMLTYYLITKI